MRRFPVEILPVADQATALSRRASHHLLHVLRLGTGARILLFDGRGMQVEAVVQDVTESLAVVRATSTPSRAAPTHALHLLLGQLKGPAMDLAIRMATEAGATEIHPMRCARSVAKGDRRDRWHRIAAAAAGQCGRADVPQIHGPSLMSEALLRPGDMVRVVAAFGGVPLHRAVGPAAVVIGPEGGLTPHEIEEAMSGGYEAVTLGSWTLRADTAVAVALAGIAPNAP